MFIDLSVAAVLICMATAFFGLIALLFVRGRRKQGFYAICYSIVGAVLIPFGLSLVQSADMDRPASTSPEVRVEPAPEVETDVSATTTEEPELELAQPETGRPRPGFSSDLTLEGYAGLDADERHEFVDWAIADASAPTDDREHFIDCMGSMAADKNGDLDAHEVFGWCETQRQNNRERFTGYFNELAAEDLSRQAGIMCNRYVELNLKAPATADFPLFDQRVWAHGEWRYSIRSYVDAENSFGANIRRNYLCKIQYKGEGEELDPRNWTLLDLSFE